MELISIKKNSAVYWQKFNIILRLSRFSLYKFVNIRFKNRLQKQTLRLAFGFKFLLIHIV
jgi:hypothetical protein